MRKRELFFSVILLLVLLVSSGCKETAETPATPTHTPPATNTLEPPTPTATSALTYQTNDGITIGTNLNCPDRAAFGYIDENIPMGGALVSDPALLRW